MTTTSDPSGPSSPTPPTTESPTAEPRAPRPRVFGRWGFWIVAFPFIFYLVGTMAASNLEDMRIKKIKGELASEHDEDAHRLKKKDERDVSEIPVDPNERIIFGLLPLGKSSFPYTYMTNILLTAAIMLAVCWGYLRAPLKFTPWGLIVGVLGIVVWIALTELDRHYIHLGSLVSKGRPSFNPFKELQDDQRFLMQFLAARFFGLVIVVPIIEEFFLRGFLMRYVDDPDWDEVPLGTGKLAGWLSPTIYGVVAHPMEAFAALAWFSMVSWLYKKTGSIWDCVVAHAVTNLLLGLYVVYTGSWYYW